MQRVSEFGDAITRVARVSQSQTISEERTLKSATEGTASAKVKGLKPEFGVESKGSDSDEARISQTYTEVFQNNIIFLDLFRDLEAALAALGVTNPIILLTSGLTSRANCNR